MADLFAQPQGYGTPSYEARSEYDKERIEMDVPFPTSTRWPYLVIPAEPPELADFTIGPTEHFCPKCHLIHRLAVPCDD